MFLYNNIILHNFKLLNIISTNVTVYLNKNVESIQNHSQINLILIAKHQKIPPPQHNSMFRAGITWLSKLTVF